MDIKKRLQQYSEMKLELNQLLEKIECIKSNISNLQSFKGEHNNDGDLVDMIATLSNLQTVYIKKSSRLLKETMKIENIISRLEPHERFIIREKYFECKTWEVICVELHYSYRGIQNIHSRILQKLRKSA